jgi:hypothetical protein
MLRLENRSSGLPASILYYMATSLPWMDGSRSQALHFNNLRMFLVRTLPKSSCIDAVASGDTGNADLVTKRYRRVYKGRQIPLGKTFPMWAAWGISGAAKPLR